jgi:hypothetical protein
MGSCNPKQLFGVFAIAGLALSIAGCSKPAGSLSGRVIIDGKPVAGGRLSFVSKDGKVLTFRIDADGSYHAEGVPTGEVTVLVIGARAESGASPKAKDAMAKKLRAAKHAAPTATADSPIVPAKYGDPTTSDLRYTVEPGSHTYDPPLN